MKEIFAAFLAFVGLSMAAHAQSTSTTSLPAFSASRFSADMLVLSEFHRDEMYRVDGVMNSLDLTGGYKISDTFKARLRVSAEYDDIQEREVVANLNGIQAHLQAFNLLHQKLHGVNLMGEARLGYTTYEQARMRYGSYGEQSLRFYPSIRLSNMVKLKSSLRYYYYPLNDYKSDYSWRFRRRADIGAELKYGDWKFNVNTEYSHITKEGEDNDEEYVELEPMIRYAITKKLNVSVSAEYRILESFDKEGFRTDAYRDGAYTLGLFARLF